MGKKEYIERVREKLLQHLPYCPFCKSDSGYKFTSRIIDSWLYFQCLSCKAEWRIEDLHQGQKPAKVEFKKLPSGLPRNEPKGVHVLNKHSDLNFWQNFEENYDKRQDSRIQSLQKRLSEAILLPEEEKVIIAWAGLRCTLSVSSGRSANVLGLLYLTNKRLIWLQRGVFNFDLPLEALMSVSLIDWRIPKWGPYYPPEKMISIKSTSSKNINEFFKFKFGSSKLKFAVGKQPFTNEKIKKTIEEATQNRLKEIHREKTSEKIQVVFDFRGLKKTMEQGGVIMTAFKCPSCHSNLPVPDSGKLLICEYCNTPIKAVDIFEKIKSLLD